jgi:hypothetical protein
MALPPGMETLGSLHVSTHSFSSCLQVMEHWQAQTETQNGKFRERNSKWKISKIQGTGIEM